MRAATRLFLFTPFVMALGGLTACDDHLAPATTTVVITPCTSNGNTVAIGANTGNVISFDRAIASSGSAVKCSRTVSGLDTGESIIGIDVRSNSTNANNAKVYALTNKAALYLLDPTTGFVSGKVALKSNATTPTNTCTPAVTAFTALSGTNFGIDFNPAVDRLRVVSDTGQNLRINVDTGEVTVDCKINAASGSTSVAPSAAAYINATSSTAAAASTQLFYIDATTDKLLTNPLGSDGTTRTSPNTGTVSEVGALGIDVTAVNGFDIDGNNGNKAYATLTTGTGSSASTGFYTINLSTGAATAIGTFTGGEPLKGLALK